jgi:GNAT superfamily N-acetyltransferase
VSTIRIARPEEAEMLSALCRRSKAHWGYDAQFMRLSEAALAVPRAPIEHGHVLVAEDAAGAPLGMASVEALERQGELDLAHFFVEPAAFGTGVGRALFAQAVELAKAKGARRLIILSDPNAVAFYLRMGAVAIGDAPSDAIPGRRLPLLRYEIEH